MFSDYVLNTIPRENERLHYWKLHGNTLTVKTKVYGTVLETLLKAFLRKVDIAQNEKGNFVVVSAKGPIEKINDIRYI